MLIKSDEIDGPGSLQRQLLSTNSCADGLARLHRSERRERPMSASPQVQVRLDILGLPCTTITIRINEDSPATIACHLDMLEHLIAHYGATAFFGEPGTDPPRQAA
jgi:hypothetical protein